MSNQSDQPVRIVFLDRDTIAPQIVLRRPDFKHAWTEYNRTAPDEILSRLCDGTSVVITNKVPLRGPLLEKLPNVRMIAVAATGTDVVDVAYCRDHGITVSNIRGYAIDTVPE
ncbi:MAG: glycerate dehydrogenase, partial [Rhodoplanes sp.]